MTDNPNIKVFWPAGPNGERSAMPLPYYIGLIAGAPAPVHASGALRRSCVERKS